MRLKEVRKSHGLTQREVAEQVGVNQNTYSYWENGKTRIDNLSLQKLAEIFDVSVDYLLGNDATYTVASPNGNHNTVTTGDIHINQTAQQARSESEKLLSVFDRLSEESKTRLMSVAYLLLSDEYKRQGADLEQQLHKFQHKGGGENGG